MAPNIRFEPSAAGRVAYTVVGSGPALLLDTIDPQAFPLLTPGEMDEACKTTASFRPPGS